MLCSRLEVCDGSGLPASGANGCWLAIAGRTFLSEVAVTMFHDIDDRVLEAMHRLEALDAEERRRGLPAPERLCAVPPETGRLLALLAAEAPAGALLEIGTSGGYSTLWLSRAARLRGGHVRSFERSKKKLAIARDTFARTRIEHLLEITAGDVREYLPGCQDIAFCLMDHDKGQYQECYELLVPKLVAGGLLAADNILSHREALAPFVAHVMADPRVDAVVVPIGKGVLLTRKV
jgi:caffeoyl-CoA O-methyltransferase